MTHFEYGLMFVAGFAAAVLSGSVGFGGGLLLLPLLTYLVGPDNAVPLLTIAQIIANLSRAILSVREICWRPVGTFLLTALPMAVLGAYLFAVVPSALIVRLMGVIILGFVIFDLTGRLQLNGKPKTVLIGGAVTGYLSGLVGSAGPLAASVFLALKLPPTAYVASEATAALVMHIAKSVVYQNQQDATAQWTVPALILSVSAILEPIAFNRRTDFPVRRLPRGTDWEVRPTIKRNRL